LTGADPIVNGRLRRAADGVVQPVRAGEGAGVIPLEAVLPMGTENLINGKTEVDHRSHPTHRVFLGHLAG
jgi:hypothetical protein